MTPPPAEMVNALGDRERFLHERQVPLPMQLALAPYEFETIHPSLEGNGRIGRLLIPLMLVLRGTLPHGMRTRLLEEGRPNSVVRLAEHLLATPVVTAAHVPRLLAVTRPTANAAIAALVDRGDMVEITGRDLGRMYEAPAILAAVYGPMDPKDAGGH